MEQCIVPHEKLRVACDPSCFEFATTEEVAPLEGIVGQERAERAIKFGLHIQSQGYNIYMAGPPGTGKNTYARTITDEVAPERDVPDDWCYVYNFEQPDEPVALRLPAGYGAEFQSDIKELIDDLTQEIPKAFDSEDYDDRRSEVVRGFQERINELFSEMEDEARQEGFAIKRTSAGFVTIPIRDGEALSQDEYNQLSEEEKEEYEEKRNDVQSAVSDTIRRAKALEKEAQQQIQQLEKNVALFAVNPLFERLEQKYSDYEAVLDHLGAIKQDVIDNLDDFKDGGDEQPMPFPFARRASEDDGFTRYRVNLLVDNGGLDGAPVIVESNPTFHNILGKVEYEGQFGNLVTDFTMIKPGALHRANGGFLILQARDVLMNFGTWDALKRMLRNQEICIENPGEQYRIIATQGLRPEPIPLTVKVLLIGEPYLYHLLYFYDPDFRKLFKIRADFDTEMARTDKHLDRYAAFISSVCKREGLKHFDKHAVARVVDYSTRITSDHEKLSTRFNEVTEVIYEANAWAELEGGDLVGAEHVAKAIEEKAYRSKRLEEKLLEMFERGKLLVDVEGSVTGQVNGLSVLDLGDYSFGKPSRITANVYMGKEGVVNIERETELSGSIHDKGLLILSGYLGRKYAQDKPLTLSASLTFEQLYEGVDGDSASSAELYALLSALADAPIRQDLAVTGSVNQKGEVQPIGGANEKIEGFYHVCKVRGITGTQGVLIPVQNVDNLMLKDEIVEAVRDGRFHIYAVRTIDEGIELLTGIPAGQPDENGEYPKDTIHYRVNAKLHEWTETMAALGGEGTSAGEETDG